MKKPTKSQFKLTEKSEVVKALINKDGIFIQNISNVDFEITKHAIPQDGVDLDTYLLMFSDKNIKMPVTKKEILNNPTFSRNLGIPKEPCLSATLAVSDKKENFNITHLDVEVIPYEPPRVSIKTERILGEDGFDTLNIILSGEISSLYIDGVRRNKITNAYLIIDGVRKDYSFNQYNNVTFDRGRFVLPTITQKISRDKTPNIKAYLRDIFLTSNSDKRIQVASPTIFFQPDKGDIYLNNSLIFNDDRNYIDNKGNINLKTKGKDLELNNCVSIKAGNISNNSFFPENNGTFLQVHNKENTNGSFLFYSPATYSDNADIFISKQGYDNKISKPKQLMLSEGWTSISSVSEYLKLQDGTLIIKRIMSYSPTSYSKDIVVTWDFPIKFTTHPFVSVTFASDISGYTGIISHVGVTLNSANILVKKLDGGTIWTTESFLLNLLAVGRWK